MQIKVRMAWRDVIDGREMAEMTDSSLAYVAALIFIYARVSRSCETYIYESSDATISPSSR